MIRFSGFQLEKRLEEGKVREKEDITLIFNLFPNTYQETFSVPRKQDVRVI